MKLTLSAQAPKGTGIIVVRFLTQEDAASLRPGVPEAEFGGKLHQLLFLRDEEVLCVGVGAVAELQVHRLRSAAGAAIMHLRKIGRRRAVVELAEWPEFAGAAVEGALLADYRFERFQPKPSVGMDSLLVLVPAAEVAVARKAMEHARAVAEATNAIREIGNTPGNLLYPAVLAAQAQELGRQFGFKVTVFDEARLLRQKFGGIMAVGQGSARGPRMLVLEHLKGKKGEQPLALVGEAVTFDTGGISIKPAANMEEMIFDKCGGMAVLGAMVAVAALKLPRNVVAVIPVAENMPSANAYRPGDIVRAYDGTHIEVINTDAEGRVILGDAIAYARQDLKACAIVDLATLTGVCGVALGEYAAGLWTNDTTFGASVRAASERAGERLWLMPSFTEYDDQIKSKVGQLKNTGGRLGGACTGAAFLRAFARTVPWAHLDIAYMASRENDTAFMSRGATGFGVRTLVELVEHWNTRSPQPAA